MRIALVFPEIPIIQITSGPPIKQVTSIHHVNKYNIAVDRVTIAINAQVCQYWCQLKSNVLLRKKNWPEEESRATWDSRPKLRIKTCFQEQAEWTFFSSTDVEAKTSERTDSLAHRNEHPTSPVPYFMISILSSSVSLVSFNKFSHDIKAQEESPS